MNNKIIIIIKKKYTEKDQFEYTVRYRGYCSVFCLYTAYFHKCTIQYAYCAESTYCITKYLIPLKSDFDGLHCFCMCESVYICCL